MNVQNKVAITIAACMCLGSVCVSAAAEPKGKSHGFLGVYVVEGDGGVIITDFIEKTPAYDLYKKNKIGLNHTIIKLAGKKTETVDELRDARDRIPSGKQGKMILLDDDGDKYHVWISMRKGPVGTPRVADGWSAPKQGTGGDGDLRDDSNPDVKQDDDRSGEDSEGDDIR